MFWIYLKCYIFYVLIYFINLFPLNVPLHIHWLKSPWRWVNIFRYSPSTNKMVVLFVNKGKLEKVKPVKRNHCNKNHCRMMLFFLIFNSYLFVSRENPNKRFNFFSDFLTYPGNQCNNLCWIYSPWSSYRPRKADCYLDLGQCFPAQIKKQFLLYW